MLKKWGGIVQIAFTYVGTVVGAGFATGQEILQFFTRYGALATATIGIATILFVWLGIKLMLLANELSAQSYEDLNALLFGPKLGSWVSLFTLLTLFGVTTVMLAGAGSVFTEQLNLPLQSGLLFTLLLAYVLLHKGMDAILAVNSVVVPLMFGFSALSAWTAWHSPGANNWLALETGESPERVWFAPFLYAAFNLAMAQAVLVPLGARIKDRAVLYWGGVFGGIGIGAMLLAGHFALSAHMPEIARYDIPMGRLINGLGLGLQLMFVLVIYGEIFTTFLADVYGLALQIEQRAKWPYKAVVPVLLLLSYVISQIGFKTLISFLYPLFGMLSIAWMVMMMWRKNRPIHSNRH